MPITKTNAGDGVLVFELTFPRGNAINHAFIDEITESLDVAHAEDARAVVITGHGRAFCAGLDLLEIYDYDKATMARFVDAFDDMFAHVFAFPKPLVAAISGHAIAGGCVLALAADYRIMTSGPYTIGLNEVAIGLPFPGGALEVSRFSLPPSLFTEWFLEGRRFTPDEALRDGVLHRVSDTGSLLSDAIAKARALAHVDSLALKRVKAALRAETIARIARTKAESRAQFVEDWFLPGARARIGALREELLRKRRAPSPEEQ